MILELVNPFQSQSFRYVHNSMVEILWSIWDYVENIYPDEISAYGVLWKKFVERIASYLKKEVKIQIIMSTKENSRSSTFLVF